MIFTTVASDQSGYFRIDRSNQLPLITDSPRAGSVRVSTTSCGVGGLPGCCMVLDEWTCLLRCPQASPLRICAYTLV